MTGNCSDCGVIAEYPSMFAGMKLHCKSCPSGWVTLPPKTPAAGTQPIPIPAPVPLSKFVLPEPQPYVPVKKPEPSFAPAPFVARRATENNPLSTPFPKPGVEPGFSNYSDTNATNDRSVPPDFAMQEVPRSKRVLARIVDDVMLICAVMSGFAMTRGTSMSEIFSTLHLSMLLGPLAIYLIVHIVLISSRGQSIGKILFDIQIVRYGSWDTVGFVRGYLLRDLLSFLITITPFIGVIYKSVDPIFMFGQERRCLHDYIAGTAVVRRPRRSF